MVEEGVAADVRAALSKAGAICQVKMFCGIGFLLNGNIIAAVSKRGLLLRVGKRVNIDVALYHASPHLHGTYGSVFGRTYGNTPRRPS